jgi:hypothetical protein
VASAPWEVILRTGGGANALFFAAGAAAGGNDGAGALLFAVPFRIEPKNSLVDDMLTSPMVFTQKADR